MLIGSVSVSSAQIIMTQVMDGDLTGGEPKYVEIKNVSGATIDFSSTNYYVLTFNNGGTSVTNSNLLDSGTLANGDYLIVTNDLADFELVYGAGPYGNVTVIDGVIGINGDDVVAISTTNSSAGIIDVFGNLGTTDVDYNDSIAKRVGDGENTTWDANAQADWDITADNLDTLDASQHLAAAPIGVNTSLPVELDSFIVD